MDRSGRRTSLLQLAARQTCPDGRECAIWKREEAVEASTRHGYDMDRSKLITSLLQLAARQTCPNGRECAIWKREEDVVIEKLVEA